MRRHITIRESCAMSPDPGRRWVLTAVGILGPAFSSVRVDRHGRVTPIDPPEATERIADLNAPYVVQSCSGRVELAMAHHFTPTQVLEIFIDRIPDLVDTYESAVVLDLEEWPPSPKPK